MHYLRDRYLAESMRNVIESKTMDKWIIDEFGKEYAPKKIVKIYTDELKKCVPKLKSVTVRKAEGDISRGFDFSVYAVLDLELADGEKVGVAYTLYVARGEASAIAQADAPRGVISTYRGSDAFKVAGYVAREVRDRFSAKTGLKEEVKYTLKQNPNHLPNVEDQYSVIVDGKKVARVNKVTRKLSKKADWTGISEPSQGPVKSTKNMDSKEAAAEAILSTMGL